MTSGTNVVRTIQYNGGRGSQRTQSRTPATVLPADIRTDGPSDSRDSMVPQQQDTTTPTIRLWRTERGTLPPVIPRFHDGTSAVILAVMAELRNSVSFSSSNRLLTQIGSVERIASTLKRAMLHFVVRFWIMF